MQIHKPYVQQTLQNLQSNLPARAPFLASCATWDGPLGLDSPHITSMIPVKGSPDGA